jgi:tetratricopeptide (TPR) repeat protein/tRNA A-37 threonylcarbamoyl transferase component Bud32
MTKDQSDQSIARDPQYTETQPDGPESAGDAGSGPSMPAAMPKEIGSFHLKRLIASGGMGTVYEAVQEHPRRTVAVKVMRKGIASRSALRRFEYESQILARLRHPGIAQVFEAGTHDDGAGAVPYFAMEYIPNAKAITEYAREKKLSTRRRLELFAHVCAAVHHGHQKGVIHRDLKPGNILIDSHGEVKIIDFGVARGTDSDMVVTTLQTDVGQLIGTLQYMSPEQCEADPHDIDIRSDVYALGVVLYELLCGKLPYDVSQKPVYESTRVIREQQPTRLSTIDAALKGDCETIVLKALEKNRERRYQSAVELGQDIHRCLAGEAIVARPPSIVYQFRIFARRNKALFAATGAVFVALLGGLIVSTWLYLQTERARAETARERDRAVAAEVRAEHRRAEADAVTRFLSEMLASVDPDIALGSEVTVKQILDQASDEVDTAFPDQPSIEASLRATIGSTYRALGKYAAGERHLRAALRIRRRQWGEEHPDVAASLNNLAWLLLKKGDFAAAEPLYREALAMRRKLLDEDHPDLADSLNNLANLLIDKGDYAAAESLHREALAIREKLFGREHLTVSESLNNLASVLEYQDKRAEAEPLHRESLALRRTLLGDQHPRVATVLNNLGGLLRRKGDYAAAEPLLREALAIRRKALGTEHPAVATSLNNLALLLRAKGDTAAAEPLYREALAMRRKLLGNQHPRVANILSNLGYLLQAKGDYAAAELLYREALSIIREVHGDEHPTVARDLRYLAATLVGQGDHAAAEPLLRQALAINRKIRPEDNLRRARVENSLGGCLVALGRYDEAEPLLLESYPKIKAVKGDRDRSTHRAVERIVELYEGWDKPDKAAEWRAKSPATQPTPAPVGEDP